MPDQRRINLPLVEKDQIVVGLPLPFSIFSAEGNLLLAAGRIVESEHARQILLNHGTRRGARTDNNMPPRAEYDATDHPTVSPLTTFQNSYRRGNATHRFSLSMARNETSEAFRTWVIGVYDRIMVVAAPVRSNGALVAVITGQVWLCRTFQATSAFRFHGTVLRVAFEPFPHVHVEVPLAVEKRKIRNRMRVTVLVGATLESPAAAPCILVDLSAGGGRIATASGVLLERDQPIRVAMTLELAGSRYELSLPATVVRTFGSSDRQHPQVTFYGIRFESLSEFDSLLLHGFVNGHLALELNCLWQVLSAASAGDEGD
jgi:hypothetical protein